MARAQSRDRPRPSRRTAGLVALPAVALLVAAAGHLHQAGASLRAFAGLGGSAARVDGSLVARRAIIPRPVGGPPVRMKVPYYAKVHAPEGSERPRGPIRRLLFNRTVTNTLENGIDPDGQGGLYGRYRDEVAAHLAEFSALREAGETPGVSLFWDFENMGFDPVYRIQFHEQMGRVLRWLAGVCDLPVTRVELVEFTRLARTPEKVHQNGYCKWHNTLRQLGAVVHRAWPRMSDAADVIILEGMGKALDRFKEQGSKGVICLLSGDKGFNQMIEAAQSEGVTVITITPRMWARYYPGGANFSIPMQIPPWRLIKRDLLSIKLDPLRPAEEWLPEHGPQKWQGGILDLQPAEPEAEMDRRRLHGFLDKASGGFLPDPNRFEGNFRRYGLRLNHTLLGSMQMALERTGSVGTRRGRLKPEAYEALERDLIELREPMATDKAAIFWNFEDMRLLPAGPPQWEMLGRIVRWMEGFANMPVRRVEVSRFVEPWEKFGAYGLDWLYAMQKVGMHIHRVWPPRSETTNKALTRSIAVLAKAAVARRGTPEEAELPRLVVVLSRDLYFDDAMRAAQKAGISAVWFGKEERAIYYPANSEEQVRLDILEWDTLMKELGEAVRNPFSDAPTPDAPVPVTQRGAFPVDVKWGRSDELNLEEGELKITAGDLELLRSQNILEA